MKATPVRVSEQVRKVAHPIRLFSHPRALVHLQVTPTQFSGRAEIVPLESKLLVSICMQHVLLLPVLMPVLVPVLVLMLVPVLMPVVPAPVLGPVLE